MKAYECEGQMSLFDGLLKNEGYEKPAIGTHIVFMQDGREYQAIVEDHCGYDMFWVRFTGRTPHDDDEEYGDTEGWHLSLRGYGKSWKYESDQKQEEQVAADNEEKNCQFSGHTCNKENLWDIADELDEVECQHTCCRECNEKLCGARCNGSEEPAAAVQEKYRDTFRPLLTDTDVFYYTDEELPTVEDVYCGLTTTDMDYLNARYVAYAKDRWWCWDSYRRQWSPAEDTKETVIIWYSIPEKYQSDSTLVYARELNGILGEEKPLAWR